MDKCIFCGSEEEVSLLSVDTPANLQPVCIACWESFLDACRVVLIEEDKANA